MLGRVARAYLLLFYDTFGGHLGLVWSSLSVFGLSTVPPSKTPNINFAGL